MVIFMKSLITFCLLFVSFSSSADVSQFEDIKKYYINEGKNNNFEECLLELFKFKQDVNSFFDNVKVNDENELIKKNRLELLNLLCKSFDNFFNFSKIEG